MSSFTIKPLINLNSEIFCHLLTINSEIIIKIVIDCGIDNNFDYSIYSPEIIKEIKESSCILITSFDIAHFGAIGLFSDMKVYCSVPTATLGKIMLDNANSKNINFIKNIEDLNFNKSILNEINVIMIKFKQPFFVKNIEICAYNAGNIVGNCLFRIKNGSDSFIVGYNINHRKENYLDGFSDFTEIFQSNVFLTNSKYGIPSGQLLNIEKNCKNFISKNNILLKNRDENINEFIDNCLGKVIISVSISRLVELCLLIKTGVFVVSNINIMDRVKSMAEWAGSRSTALFEMNISFGKIEEINKKVIIVINDYKNSIYLGAVLNKYHSKNDTLIIINNKKDKLIFPIYEINYKWIKKEKLPEIVIPKENKIIKKFDEWYKNDWVVFFDKNNLNLKFPIKKRRIIDNDYGENINFKFEDVVVEKEIPQIKIEELEIETIKDFGKIIEIRSIEDEEHITENLPCLESEENCKDSELNQLKMEENVFYMNVEYYQFKGISDLKSIKTIIESFNPENVLLVPDENFCSKFVSNSLNDNFKTYVVDNELKIDLPNKIKDVKISDEVISVPYKNIGNKKVFLSKIKKNENIISSNLCEVKNQPIENIVLGDLNLTKLKTDLVKNDFFVENFENGLIVEEKLKILYKDNCVFLDSEENDLLLAVREILYKYIAIL